MANMVTRTIISTKATCIILDITTNAVSTSDYVVCGTFKKPEAIVKAVQKLLPDHCKAVHLVQYYEIEELYGMSEDVFIVNAHRLDPATRKPIQVKEER